jgi:hypothetical protein
MAESGSNVERLLPWSWLVLLALVVPALWHVVDFEQDIDFEFPKVQRHTYSRRPPASYRLAEPGDTIDRIAIYLSAGAVVLAAVGLVLDTGWFTARRDRRARVVVRANGAPGQDYSTSSRAALTPHPDAPRRPSPTGGEGIFRAADARRAAAASPPIESWEAPAPRAARVLLRSLGLGLSAAALWHASTPGPAFDGWYGLGWRSLFNPAAPWPLRSALGSAAVGLVVLALACLRVAWPQRAALWNKARERGCRELLVLAAVLVALRQLELPGVEPVGYWPRWSFVWGLAAFGMVLVRLMSISSRRWGVVENRSCSGSTSLRGVAEIPPLPPLSKGGSNAGGRLPWLKGGSNAGGRLPWFEPGRGWHLRAALIGAGLLSWLGLVVGGIWLTWYHRPLQRLKPVVAGRIYISAMPTYRGLEIAHGRLHFKTIINLFPEETYQRSPRLPQELRFVAEHGIAYYRSPTGAAQSDAFLDKTLELAQDPSAWPILIHCHGCMDRSPAWMGIYRFIVQGRPLDEIMREIERHRGYRPKASVTLLYNRVLADRAPERYARDPTAALLRRDAADTIDPYYEQLRAELAAPESARQAQRGEAARRPSGSAALSVSR